VPPRAVLGRIEEADDAAARYHGSQLRPPWYMTRGAATWSPVAASPSARRSPPCRWRRRATGGAVEIRQHRPRCSTVGRRRGHRCRPGGRRSRRPGEGAGEPIAGVTRRSARSAARLGGAGGGERVLRFGHGDPGAGGRAICARASHCNRPRAGRHERSALKIPASGSEADRASAAHRRIGDRGAGEARGGYSRAAPLDLLGRLTLGGGVDAAGAGERDDGADQLRVAGLARSRTKALSSLRR
jgi:hypothetical protein